MKAATYHRVSTRDQNPAGARDELRRRALADGYELVRETEIEEIGSGAKADRPGLLRLLDLAERKQVAAVYVWKLDRLGRSMLDLLGNVEKLRKAGVRLVCVSQSIDTGESDASTMFGLRVLAAAAEYERELIIDRTANAIARIGAELAATGCHVSRRGRTITRLGRPGADVPDEHISQAILLRARGWSWARVSNEMALLGLKQQRRQVAGEWRPARAWPTGTLRDACRKAVEKGGAIPAPVTPQKSRPAGHGTAAL